MKTERFNNTWVENRQVRYIDIYNPKSEEALNQLSKLLFEGDDDKKERLKKLKSNIYNNASVINNQRLYPVIIQLTGLGAPRDYMTFTIENLINAGYIVITLGHFYDSMLTILPNGQIIQKQNKELSQEDKKEIINIRKDDIIFLLDSLQSLNKHDEVLKNKLDLDKIGVIGHSLGGAATFRASQSDARIKAIVLYDASLQFFDLNEYVESNKKLNIPLLNFRRDHFDYGSAMKLFIDSLKKRNIGGEKFKKGIIINDKVLRDSTIEQKHLYHYLSNFKSFIKLNDSNHMTFTDYPYLMNQNVQTYQTINELTKRFFNEFLLHEKSIYSDFIKNNESITLIDEGGNSIEK